MRTGERTAHMQPGPRLASAVSVALVAMAVFVTSSACSSEVSGTPTAVAVSSGADLGASPTIESTPPAGVTISSLYDIGGFWHGTYLCAQGRTGMVLMIDASSDTEARGQFRFGQVGADGRLAIDGSFEVAIRLTPSAVEFRAGRWLLQPPGYVPVDLRADVDATRSSLRGHVVGEGCPTFAVTRGLI